MKNLLTDVLAPRYHLPDGYDSWGIKSVRPDLRTRNEFRWPWPGSETGVYPLDDHDDSCPRRVGDGLSVALSWHGMAAGGYPAVTLLLVAYRSAEARGDDHKLRVPQAYVVDVIDGQRLISGAEADLRGTDLHGADLRGANLHKANLRWANLYGASLYGANLRGAELYGANLGWANLYEADLYGANLRGAELHGANLGWANLCEADLYGANLRGAELHGADLRGANLAGACLRGASGLNTGGSDKAAPK